jgi:gamma-butyrobetaine dioxygenase
MPGWNVHCLRFDEGITGGGSFLIDGFAVAERIRRESPDIFKTLSTIPATFLKDHSKRANPVLMSYQRPHIAVDPNNAVTGLFWAPPFEGPLQNLTHQQTEEYYHAYARMEQVIEEVPTWDYRLQPNEMLVFNNRRMLHGRHAFTLGDSQVRHLQGCYVNIDEFANRYNLLKHRFGGEDGVGVLANQDWAADVISLSK